MQALEEQAQFDDDRLQWDACASHKDCETCLNASVACHFCKRDFQCHAIGSPFGCPIGVSVCHHLEDCERTKPQHVGYGPPPSVVIAVLCLIVTLTCCICGISAICTFFFRAKKSKSFRSNNGVAVKADKWMKKQAIISDDEERRRDHSQPLLLDEIREDEIRLFGNDVDQLSLERLRTRHEHEERQINWQALVSRITWLVVLIAATVIALMFYPRTPDYNVCNREFEWDSILHSILGLKPKVEYQVLVSVINENRFGFVLESGSADIYHNSTLVGKWVLDKPWKAAAGSITDIVAGINITPGYTEGIALWKDFSKNQLIFRINATIAGSITWGRYKIYRISSSIPDIEFLVGAEYDRGLCMCTEYLTPT